jgi:PIN domain nuclease of toxin-antitoxin system
VILLDAYALVAFFAGERAGPEVASLLRAGSVAIATPNLAEVVDVLIRVRGHTSGSVHAALVPLLATTIEVLPLEEQQARRAALLRAAHYHRLSSPLSLADCFLLAIAEKKGAGIATSDPPVAKVARAEGIGLEALPDARGRRP